MSDHADHQARAAATARAISAHHQGCAACQRGGRLAVGPRGVRRIPCETERQLFAQLAQQQEAGWPAKSPRPA